jgi:hypothetical protein
MTSTLASRRLAPIGRTAGGQPRTFRLEPRICPASSRQVAYRRLALAILGLDVSTLALELRAVRRESGTVKLRAA